MGLARLGTSLKGVASQTSSALIMKTDATLALAIVLLLVLQVCEVLSAETSPQQVHISSAGSDAIRPS